MAGRQRLLMTSRDYGENWQEQWAVQVAMWVLKRTLEDAQHKKTKALPCILRLESDTGCY